MIESHIEALIAMCERLGTPAGNIAAARAQLAELQRMAEMVSGSPFPGMTWEQLQSKYAIKIEELESELAELQRYKAALEKLEHLVTSDPPRKPGDTASWVNVGKYYEGGFFIVGIKGLLAGPTFLEAIEAAEIAE